MADVAPVSLPFREQSAFFRRKLNLPTTGWTDLYTQEHDWAFVVAGANRDALVADFRQAVQRVIDEGSTLEEFRRDFDRIVTAHGWDYNGGRNWRSRVIYDTNLSTTYAAGRFEQMQAGKADRPFWQYRHADWVQHPREQHLAWNGLVLAADDPWWRTHYPPNGWGCQCSVRALNFRDLVRLGKDGPDTAPPMAWQEREIGQRSPMGPRRVRVPQGVDPGFEYTPGRARLAGAVPPALPDAPQPGPAAVGLPNRRPPGPLPEARPAPAAPLDVPGFLAQFGATPQQPAVWRDAVGERLVMGAPLFDGPAGESLASRPGLLPLLAQTLRDPDEVWTRIEWQPDTGRAAVRRRYLAQWRRPGQAGAELVVAEWGPDGWTATTLQDATAGDPWRTGVRLYRRDED